MASRLVIFLHLPKTGGTTIYTNVKQNLKDRSKAKNLPLDSFFDKLFDKPKSYLDNINFLQGHKTYMGIHEKFSHDEFVYFTILRNPADLIVSFYNYSVSLNGENLSFDEWYPKLKNNYSINFYSKNQPVPKFLVLLPFLNRLFSDDFVKYIQAKKVLKKCLFVGLTEKLNKDLPLIFKLIGVNINNWENRLVSVDSDVIPKLTKGPKFRIIYKRQKVTSHVEHKIEKNNKWDIKLYKYAKKTYNKKRKKLERYLHDNDL